MGRRSRWCWVCLLGVKLQSPEDKIPGWDPCKSLTVTVSVATLNRVRRRVLGRCHGEGS